MQGIPMVASSPVRHDSPLGVHPLEVQAYQPPWKALSDFALHSDLEQPHAPAFQQLVNQVRYLLSVMHLCCKCLRRFPNIKLRFRHKVSTIIIT